MVRKTFSGCKTFKYGLCLKPLCPLSDYQEWRFQAAKRSDMISAIMQEGRFADPQRLRFQAANRSEIGTAILQGGRFSDAQESCFYAGNVQYGTAVLLFGISVCRLRNRNMRSSVL